MIRINLLPYRAKRKKENVQRQVIIFLSMLVILFIGIFVFNTIINGSLEAKKGRVVKAQRELAANKKKAAEAAKLKKGLDNLKKKTQIIANLNKKRKDPVKLLEKMTEVVVAERMWFTQFNDAGNVVSMNGIALDSDAVAQFLKNLEASKLFHEVKLLKTELKEVGKKNLQNFQIRCMKNAPPKPKATKKKRK